MVYYVLTIIFITAALIIIFSKDKDKEIAYDKLIQEISKAENPNIMRFIEEAEFNDNLFGYNQPKKYSQEQKSMSDKEFARVEPDFKQWINESHRNKK